MQISNKQGWFSWVAPIALIACGGFSEDISSSDEMDEIGMLSQGLGSGCGEEPSQFDFTGKVTPNLVSSAYSGGCDGNSIMVDIDNYNGSYLSPALSPATIPTTQALCENTLLGYYVWERSSPTNIYLANDWAYGEWMSVLGAPECVIYIGSPATLTAGKYYRFGITARQYNVPVSLRFKSVLNPH